jgi:hypothetical protein
MDSKNYYKKYLKYKLKYINLKKPNENNQEKRKLVEYINLLYKVLNKTDSCFIKGSFVIDDCNNKLKPILAKAQSDKLIPMESHIGFVPYNGLYKICSKSNGLCEVNLSKYPVTINCGEHSLERKNIKWYTFNNTKDKNDPQRFVFFKLEGSSTLTVSHLKQAIVRYALRRPSDSPSLPTRREDCAIENNCKCTNECSGDPSGYQIGSNKICQLTQTTHERLGDEFFISSQLNSAILAKQSIEICQDILNYNNATPSLYI